jgi:glycosyltransferase involved in cell wall biosynthesis
VIGSGPGGGGTAPTGAPDPRRASTLAVVWRVLRAEGPRAVVARFRDRLGEARRRRSFRPAAAPPPGFSCAVLNLAAGPPAPRLGGAQAQLLWRLAAEAELRPVALLYAEAAGAGGGFRLELQRGRERRALRLPPEIPGAARATAAGMGEPLPASTDGSPTAGGAGSLPAGVAPAFAAVSGGAAPLTALAEPELERAAAWAAALCGASTLQVEGLAGMPLGSLLRLRQDGLRLVLAVHDFAAFCPRPHLLESLPPPAAPRFCHYSRDPQRCARCLDRDVAGLPSGYQEERRELARRLLAGADAVVYPSAFLARVHDELFGGAGAAGARVIAPALPTGAGTAAAHVIAPAAPPPTAAAAAGLAPQPAAERPRSRGPGRPPRHVAWVGAVQPHKGALVFEAAVQQLAAAGRRPRLTAYGGGDPEILARWRRLPGLRVRGYYRAGSLPALLRRARVDLALLLSVVPESYGLALDECAAAGVPVIAFDLGAPAERIAAASSGLLLAAPLVAGDPAAAGAALATVLGDLLDGRLDMPPASPAPPGPGRGPAAAASAWSELYRELALLAPRH